MKNKKLIAGVHCGTDAIDMKTNTGSRMLREKGIAPGRKQQFYCDPESMANIWDFHGSVGEHRVTHDSAKEDAFKTHAEHGIKKTKKSDEGLHHTPLSEA